MFFLAATLLIPAAAHAQERAKVVTASDVLYGRVHGSGLLAELAYPEGGSHLPVVMYIHGGRWRGGTKTNNSWTNLSKWAEAGFFTMSIDYRLVGGSPAPAAYEDTQTAIRWLHANAAKYGLDTNRIYLIGDSAGGHLVALAATLGDGPYTRSGGWEKERNDITAVISVAGAYDVNTLPWGDLWTPVGGDVQAARRQASPMHHISPTTKPILIIHSDDDKSVPIQQAIDMAKALETAKVRHKFVHYKDRGHMGLTDEVLQETRAFINDLEKK
jgi:acetyl esterase/lipase